MIVQVYLYVIVMLVQHYLNLLTWNVTGIMSSCTHLCDMLSARNVDICGISEHWLYSKDLHFLDKLDNVYKSYATSDFDLNLPSRRRAGKGGVAFLYHKRLSSRITHLCLESDRITGLQYEFCKNQYMYIFQVYLPSSNHSMSVYRDCCDDLRNILYCYADKGEIVIMGDINAHLSSAGFKKPKDHRTRFFEDLMAGLNIESVNRLDFCQGPAATFVSPVGQSSIDHILIPVEKLDTVNCCEIIDGDVLNFSNHRPVFCRLCVPLSYNQYDASCSRRIKWSKVSNENLQKYEDCVNSDVVLTCACATTVSDTTAIDSLYDKIVTGVLSAADNCIPKGVFRRHLKPYWCDELSVAHKTMGIKRKVWIEGGKRSTGESYLEYKNSKRVFRKLHRIVVQRYIQKMYCEIDKAAELDHDTFWRLVNSRRKPSCSNPGSELCFDNVTCRDSESIAEGWGCYFSKLYSPSCSDDYDEHFKQEVEKSNRDYNAKIDALCMGHRSNFHCEFSIDDIDGLLKCTSRSKASGTDNVCYEHLIHGGHIVRVLLSKLFTAMYYYSYIPPKLKEGEIITLFKGGNKVKHDPCSYRAITLSSVILKLYEKLLLVKLKNISGFDINIMQGGFRENMGCLMTSFALRECITFAKENRSKLYACMLDARQAFDRVWHEGLFYKLRQYGVDPLTYNSLRGLYSGMKSRVRVKGVVSDWLEVKQGTRQGGVTSPFLYLMYINGLIEKLEASRLGFCIFNDSCSCPTVADDMLLLSLSPNGLQQMMTICYEYSCQWRYDYNASKCAVIVFNETEHAFKRCTRVWQLGKDEVKERDSYTHLGIICDKYQSEGKNVKNACNKLKSTFLGLLNIGLHEKGLHPLTSLKIYTSIVLPKALYGSDIWFNLSKNQLLELERAHRFCLKHIQCIPRQSRTVVCLSLLGKAPIEFEIDKRKLIFFGQLCRLSVDHFSRKIFFVRLSQFLNNVRPISGLIPEIVRLLTKYDLYAALLDFCNSGAFPTKGAWKHVVNVQIMSFYQNHIENSIRNDNHLGAFLKLKPNCWEVSRIWLLSRSDMNLSASCYSTVYLLNRLFYDSYTSTCPMCNCTLIDNVIVHMTLFCFVTEGARQTLWWKLSTVLSSTEYRDLIALDPMSQLLTFFSGLGSENVQDSTLRACVSFFHCIHLSLKRAYCSDANAISG